MSNHSKDADFDITPDTKIASLLNNYPELKDVLVDIAPAFTRLRNPILRKTVAKITNLRQAAKIGEVELGNLINQLRKATGKEVLEIDEEQNVVHGKPDWFDPEKVVKSFDAREMIESGGHPLDKVLTDIKGLEKNSIYTLVTPFLPAPLIEMVNHKGLATWTEKSSENEFSTYISVL